MIYAVISVREIQSYPADGDLAVAVDGASGLGVSLGQLSQEFFIGQQNGFVQEVGNSLTEEVHVGVLNQKKKKKIL